MQLPIKNLHWPLFLIATFFNSSINAQITPCKGCSEIKNDTQIIIKKIICVPKSCAPTKNLLANKNGAPLAQQPAGGSNCNCGCKTPGDTQIIVIDSTPIVANCCVCQLCVLNDSARKKLNEAQQEKNVHLSPGTSFWSNITSKEFLTLCSFLLSLFGLGKEAKKIANDKKLTVLDYIILALSIPGFCISLSLLIELFEFVLLYLLFALIGVCCLVFVAAILFFQFMKYIDKVGNRKFEYWENQGQRKLETSLAVLSQIEKIEKNGLATAEAYGEVKERILSSIAESYSASRHKLSIEIKLEPDQNLSGGILNAIAEGKIKEAKVSLTTGNHEPIIATEHSKLNFIVWDVSPGSYLLKAAVIVAEPYKAVTLTGSLFVILNNTTFPHITIRLEQEP